MATHTGTGRALEHTLHVAVLAGEVPVRPLQFVAGGQMIEQGPLHGCGRWAEPEGEQDCGDDSPEHLTPFLSWFADA